MLNKNSKIFVTGHKGLVGSSIIRRLSFLGFKNLIFRTRSQLDLTNQQKVYYFFKKNKPHYVINAAAKVGGIYANEKYPANFLYDNIQIQNNIIDSCYKFKVKDLIFLGSSCIYPKLSKQPIKEEYLLTDKLEKTNEAYAIAKISGIKLCESYNIQFKKNYKCLMPSNSYGPNDDYHELNSHFLPALIRKIYEAKIKDKKYITLWGSGNAMREMIFVDDIADACLFFLGKKTSHYLINIGSGKDMRIIDYAKLIMKKLNCNLKIKFDRSKKDGTPRKLLDNKVAKKYGWKPSISLNQGLKITIKDYIKNYDRYK
jgi:GDP-L-fucose synthase